jgi:hypothetical protein
VIGARLSRAALSASRGRARGARARAAPSSVLHPRIWQAVLEFRPLVRAGSWYEPLLRLPLTHVSELPPARARGPISAFLLKYHFSAMACADQSCKIIIYIIPRIRKIPLLNVCKINAPSLQTMISLFCTFRENLAWIWGFELFKLLHPKTARYLRKRGGRPNPNRSIRLRTGEPRWRRRGFLFSTPLPVSRHSGL